MAFQEELTLALDCARQAGVILRAKFRSSKSVAFKQAIDLVTNVDKEVENLIIGLVRQRFPEHVIVAEESVSDGKAKEELSEKPTWFIDPLDGTTNYVHGVPFVCVSIAFAVRKQLVVGVVFNPILDELFHAVQGGGAFKNGQRISVSPATRLVQSLIATGFAYERDPAKLGKLMDRLKRVLMTTRGVRRCGSAALDLAFTAAGVFNAYYERGIHSWDVAAGCVLVREAGGVVGSAFGETLEPWDLCGGEVIAGRKEIVNALKELWAVSEASLARAKL